MNLVAYPILYIQYETMNIYLTIFFPSFPNKKAKDKRRKRRYRPKELALFSAEEENTHTNIKYAYSNITKMNEKEKMNKKMKLNNYVS